MFFLAIINAVELVAAISGSNYFKKYRVDKMTRYFVYFLWVTFFIEVIFGWLTVCIHNFDSFILFDDTFLAQNNYPIYNVYYIISFAFYTFYFRNHLKHRKSRTTLDVSIILYSICSIVSLFLTDAFFLRMSSFTYIVGSILIFFSVMLYFFEIFKDDEILNFHKSIVSYIAVGTLIFHLVVTPIFIYGYYYSATRAPEFINIYRIILTVANIFMYTCYTIGFVVCSRKNKSY